MHRLAFTDVRKQYGRALPVLADCRFVWSSGIVALLGPNGAGKSTLLRIAATTTVPTAGHVTFDDTDVVARPNVLRSSPHRSPSPSHREAAVADLRAPYMKRRAA